MTSGVLDLQMGMHFTAERNGFELIVEDSETLGELRLEIITGLEVDAQNATSNTFTAENKPSKEIISPHLPQVDCMIHSSQQRYVWSAKRKLSDGLGFYQILNISKAFTRVFSELSLNNGIYTLLEVSTGPMFCIIMKKPF